MNKLTEQEREEYGRNFVPLVYKIVNDRLYSLPYTLKDDAFSAGLVGLAIAINNFDKDVGTKFITFAYRCILQETINFIVGYYKDANNKNTISLDDICVEGDNSKRYECKSDFIQSDENESPEKLTEAALLLEKILTRCAKTKREKEIISLLATGKSVSDVAKILHCTNNNVTQKRNIVKERYKQICRREENELYGKS